jgi:hypothetical protein
MANDSTTPGTSQYGPVPIEMSNYPASQGAANGTQIMDDMPAANAPYPTHMNAPQQVYVVQAGQQEDQTIYAVLVLVFGCLIPLVWLAGLMYVCLAHSHLVDCGLCTDLCDHARWAMGDGWLCSWFNSPNRTARILGRTSVGLCIASVVLSVVLGLVFVLFFMFAVTALASAPYPH